jgi:hypothetical protein
MAAGSFGCRVLIIEQVIRYASGGAYSLLGAIGRGLGSGKHIYRVYYINKSLKE